MKIITQFESVWDADLEQYVTITEESYDHEGDIAECKGGKKGGKGGVGAVLGIVASIAIPFVAPGIAAAITGSTVATVSTAAVAATGAALGGVSAAITGGDIGRGMLMGGFSAGMGAGFGGTTGASNPVNGWFGGDVAAGVGGGGGLTLPTDVGAVASTDIASMSPTSFDVMTSGSGGAVGGLDPTAATGFDPSVTSGLKLPTFDAALSAPGGADASFTSPNYALDSGGSKLATMTSTSGASAADPSYLSKVFSADNMTKAGLQLGTQALGSALTDNGAADAYANALKEQNAQNKEVFAYNVGQQDKKSAIGDQLNRDATSYDPNYFANQNATATGIAADNKWADYEQQMRAQGKDDRYINAEKSRYGIQAGLQKSSAYDAGWQRGLNAQTGTRTAAGGMYGPVTGGADMTGSYAAYAQNSGKDATDFGYGLQKAFGIDYNTDAQKQKTEQTAKANYA